MEKQGTTKFEPGVQKYLEQEEKKEITKEFRSTTKNLGYKPPIGKRKINYSDDVTKPITRIPTNLWELYNMKEYNFIQDAISKGLATAEGRMNIISTPTTCAKKLALLFLNNIDSCRVIMKNFVQPASKMTSDSGHFYFGSQDIKFFLMHHFPNDLEALSHVNSTDVMKSIMIWLEKNQTRKKEPIGLLSIVDPKAARKIFKIDKIITLFTFEELLQVSCLTMKKPHYNTSGYNTLLSEILTREENMIKAKTEEVPNDNIVTETIETPPVEEIVEELTEDSIISDEKPEPSVELECLQADQIINLEVLNRLLDKGDSIEISIKFTKSSGE